MKLKHFCATGVFGYLNFDVKFNDALTLLVGPNGSGKSTALQIMEALITPSIRDLALAEFNEAFLEYEEGRGVFRVTAQKRDEGLLISANWVDEGPLLIPELGRDKARLLNEDPRMANEYFRSLSIQISSNKTFKAISGVHAPVFLGIERRHRYSKMDESEDDRGDVNFYNTSIKRGGEVRRLLRGNLAAGLNETRALVQEAYRDARRRLDSAQVTLRNEVLLSAFMYSDVDRDSEGKLVYTGWDNHRGFRVDETRREIESALSDIGLPRESTKTRIGPFFDKLSHLVSEFNRGDDEIPPDVTLEFLMNKGQLDRLQNLISLVQTHKKRTDANFRRIQAFVETVNWFFEDSSKRMVLDVLGSIDISRKDGFKVPLDALSSGERQLLIILSHLFFNGFSTRSRVFVIDEPELSLHLRWQENLIPKIREAAPDMQLIFATHSPDIVADNDEYCVSVGGKR